MGVFELTYQHPNQDWTWEYVHERDYHAAMCAALSRLPQGCRVVKIEQMPDHMIDRVKQDETAR